MKTITENEVKNTSTYMDYQATNRLKPIDEYLGQRNNLCAMKLKYPSYADTYDKEILAVDFLLNKYNNK